MGWLWILTGLAGLIVTLFALAVLARAQQLRQAQRDEESLWQDDMPHTAAPRAKARGEETDTKDSGK